MERFSPTCPGPVVMCVWQGTALAMQHSVASVGWRLVPFSLPLPRGARGALRQPTYMIAIGPVRQAERTRPLGSPGSACFISTPSFVMCLFVLEART